MDGQGIRAEIDAIAALFDALRYDAGDSLTTAHAKGARAAEYGIPRNKPPRTYSHRQRCLWIWGHDHYSEGKKNG